MSLLLLLLLFPLTQDLFLPKFLARIRSRIPYLKFVCSYKRVLGLLQAGRPTGYPAIIETPDCNVPIIMAVVKCPNKAQH